MSIPTDKDLYDRIKQRVYNEIPKHSAYRSGHLVKEYKHAFQKKHGSKSPYKGTKKDDKGLSRWFKEEWKNQRGEVGYKKKGDVYRPTKRINSKTPTTYNELSKSQIERAKKEKKKTGRVKKFDK